MRVLRLLPGLITPLVFVAAALAGLPTVTHEGREYIELARAAAVLKTRLEATPESPQALLRPSGHVVTVTRNWSRILVDDTPMLLDAPARVREGGWLGPETVVAQVPRRGRSLPGARP